jgi:hypothetical protein
VPMLHSASYKLDFQDPSESDVFELYFANYTLLLACAEKVLGSCISGINKHFMNSETCRCFIVSEQWAGFKAQSPVALSYCRDTNLRKSLKIALPELVKLVYKKESGI